MKLTLYQFFISIVLAAGLALGLRYSERSALEEIRTLSNVQDQELERRYSSIVQQQTLGLERFLREFASSDRITDLLKRYDYESLRYELTGAMATFNVDGVWFFIGDDWKLVHTQSHPDGYLPASSPVATERLSTRIREANNKPFFVSTEKGLLELKWAVLPSLMEGGSAQPVHVLVGQLWDANKLRQLSDLSDARINLRMTPEVPAPAESINLPLESVDGQIEAYADYFRDRRLFDSVENSFERQFWYSIATLVLFSIAILFYTRLRLISAVRLVTNSFRHGSPHALQRLIEQKNELGDLARAAAQTHRNTRKLQEIVEAGRLNDIEAAADFVSEEAPWAGESEPAVADESDSKKE